MKSFTDTCQAVPSLLAFAAFYLKELVAGASRISRDVLHPAPDLRPVLVRAPLPELTSGQRLVLANLISMTPGTLTVDYLDEDSTLVIHALWDGDKPDRLLRTVATRYVPTVARLPF